MKAEQRGAKFGGSEALTLQEGCDASEFLRMQKAARRVAPRRVASRSAAADPSRGRIQRRRQPPSSSIHSLTAPSRSFSSISSTRPPSGIGAVGRRRHPCCQLLVELLGRQRRTLHPCAIAATPRLRVRPPPRSGSAGVALRAGEGSRYLEEERLRSCAAAPMWFQVNPAHS